jgi:hypothetical protein
MIENHHKKNLILLDLMSIIHILFAKVNNKQTRQNKTKTQNNHGLLKR